LIHRGHKKKDLLNEYTIDQVTLFYKMARKAQKQELADLAYAVRVAFGADQNDWRKFLKAMGISDEPEEKEQNIDALRGLLRGHR
jgi:hypothetical protein